MSIMEIMQAMSAVTSLSVIVFGSLWLIKYLKSLVSF